MTDLQLCETKLINKHLTEWRSIMASDIRAWQQLRINHNLAIEEIGWLNFTAWSQQKEEVHKLSETLALSRMKLKKKQLTELEDVLILFRKV